MLDIADVARRAGLPASTLRYYEERGLIASVARRGLRRQFDDDVLERLALITLVREAGFTLDEIRRLLPPDAAGDGAAAGDSTHVSLDRGMLTARADALDQRIAELSAVRDSMRHAAACPARSHGECPNFRSIVHAAMADPRVARRALLNGR